MLQELINCSRFASIVFDASDFCQVREESVRGLSLGHKGHLLQEQASRLLVHDCIDTFESDEGGSLCPPVCNT